MATPLAVSERILAAGDEQQALANKVVEAQRAKDELEKLNPKIAKLSSEAFDAEQRSSELASTVNELKAKKKGGVRKLFSSREKRAGVDDAYSDALAKQTAADAELLRIKTELAPLKARRGALEQASKTLQRDLDALDALYASLFDGATAKHPEEDRLEAAVKEAQALCDEIQMRLSHAAAVVNNVSLAGMRMRSAISHVKYAIQVSERELRNKANPLKETPLIDWGVADFKERTALNSAKGQIAESEKYLAIAREMDPEVGDFFKPLVTDGNTTAGDMDVWLKTPITIYLFQREMEASLEQVEECGKLLDQEVDAADQRRSVLEKERIPATEKLKDVKRQLTDLRAKLLEEALQGLSIEPDKADGKTKTTDAKTS